MLTLSDITKRYGEKEVLRGITLTVKKGETVVLSGASGGGKTTLMRIMAGLETADAGVVKRDGSLAVSFAEARLFPSATVLQNVTAVMKGEKRACEKKAREVLHMLGLSDALSLYPDEISTGMAARVSLARAIAFDADIYLLDEPLKSLDETLKESVMKRLAAFFREKAVFVISHDEDEARVLATRRYLLSEGMLSEIPK